MNSLVRKSILTATFLFAIAFVGLQAQGKMQLDPFDAISVTGNIDVILEEGDVEEATLYADGIPDDKVKAKVDKGTLKLKLLNSVFYKGAEIKVYVTYKKLRQAKAFAGGTIQSKSVIKTDKFVTKAGSGARVELSLDVNAVDAIASEGGIVKLEGSTETQKVKATTGGSYKGLDLECNRTYAKAGTGGNVYVIAREMLDASTNTGGSIDYRGNPRETNTKKILGGGVRKI